MSRQHCGLDFGTSNSTLGLSLGGKQVLCPLEGTSVTIPSAIFFDYEEHVARYGRDAITAYVEGADGRLLRSLKSVLGHQLINETTLIGRKHVAMRNIIGMFMRHVKGTAQAYLAKNGINGEIDSVVLGRPVRFVDEDDEADQRAEAELIDIARAHGFRHIETQLEPIAAALAYEQSLIKEELSLIVDLGGGTSDFVIARLSPERARHVNRTDDILGRSGVHVGGTDFDRSFSIAEAMPSLGYKVLIGEKKLPMPLHLFHDLATWHKIPFLYTPDNLAFLRSIVQTADQPDLVRRLMYVLSHRKGHQIAGEVEAAKIALSETVETRLHLETQPVMDISVSRSNLEHAVYGDTTRILMAIDACAKVAGIQLSQLQSIFLTGGSTGIPVVRQRILAHVPNARPVTGDMFGSVGLGLAIDAERRFGARQ